MKQASNDTQTPVLIGVGQATQRQVESPHQVKSPVNLASEALDIALTDAGLSNNIDLDVLVMTRSFCDSDAALTQPFGFSSGPPLSVAMASGVAPRRCVYGPEGGHTPQRLLNEFAAAIAEGQCDTVALCGAEATASMKLAGRQGWELDWRDEPAGEVEDRGFMPIMSQLERAHHVTYPTQVYAMLENAWRNKHRVSLAQQRQLIGQVLSGFSVTAARNDHARNQEVLSAEFLANPSKENYPLNVPYNKWMVAQDSVNASAAVLMTSAGRAESMGVPRANWVFLHGYADADDPYVCERGDFSTSVAMKAALNSALGVADLTTDQLTFLDLYSCFPIAILAACDALGIDPLSHPALTVTGGMPFFGGPGNNYSLHAVAQVCTQLRAAPGAYGLVSANGGYLSKHAVGIYSTVPTDLPARMPVASAQSEVDKQKRESILFPFDGSAAIDSYSVALTRKGPAMGFMVGHDVKSGKRVLAKAASKDQATLGILAESEPFGRKVVVQTTDRGAYFSFA